MSFTLCIVLIKHHAYIGDDVSMEAVVEDEPQTVEPDEEPIDFAQGRPLCFVLMVLNYQF
jgi:hypothetical protein